MRRARAITIQVPPALRAHCGTALAELSLSASSVRAALAQLEQNHPEIYRGVCDDTGAVRRHVNLFVNSVFVCGPAGLDTSLAPGDVVTIMPAVSGG